MSLDTNAILDAIRTALQDHPSGEGMTTRELAAAMNPPISVELTKLAVRRLIADGTMEPCRVRRERMDGMMTVCSAYRFKNGKPEK
jgi:hypothetical protein